MKKYKWNLRTIGLWNKATFPYETVRGQRLKCSSEAREYFNAKTYNERIEELADFYIANAGLDGRFNEDGGRLVCELMRDLPNWDEINEAVQNKMEINLTRTWEKTNTGEHRHVSEKAKSNV
jgi:hypothetical protein